ncbi:MAG: tRNA (adenosine(37)-N6)-threonylcarbamoyltransferase complex ATPase subunit type 1 TsaE [Candidatus Yonathbacteria bacterium]|nr:tRNA (adenosine(37)-N6)-threonylcarbamoyltransferase complex ATPase subunit type 1 TsaE [Candidatus Yonathbacteria bacterium]
MEYSVRTPDQMREVAREILAELSTNMGARVLALSGDLGAGKTTFVKAFARELGIDEVVTSPTFGLMRNYVIPKDTSTPFRRLVHIDAYRLEVEDDLSSLGWADIVTDFEALVCIEWPERVSEALPFNTMPVTFTHIDEQTRNVKW